MSATHQNETHEQLEARIFSERGLAILGDHAYGVPSSDGSKQYVVRFTGRGDCGETLWSCDCPAGQHGRHCKHIAAVNDFCNNQEVR